MDIFKLTNQAPNIQTWVLTSFNDTDVEMVEMTNDVKDLKLALLGLNFGGGGDVPKEAFKGIICFKIYFKNLS